MCNSVLSGHLYREPCVTEFRMDYMVNRDRNNPDRRECDFYKSISDPYYLEALYNFALYNFVSPVSNYFPHIRHWREFTAVILTQRTKVLSFFY